MAPLARPTGAFMLTFGLVFLIIFALFGPGKGIRRFRDHFDQGGRNEVSTSGWPLVQRQDIDLPPSAHEDRLAVIEIFQKSYSHYKRIAYGHDDARPLTGGFVDTRNGWGATIIDAMGTAYIMGLNEIFEDAVQHTKTIDFSRSKAPGQAVNVFETTIRYLGGILSAYQLSGARHPELLAKATEVADKLVYAWDGKNVIPYPRLNFDTNQPDIVGTSIAEAGSLSLEFGCLSDLTANDTYRRLAEGTVVRIAEQPGELPGMAPQGLDVSSGETGGNYITWGASSDSYFEYLIKYPRLIKAANPIILSTWSTAVDSSIRYLLQRTIPGNWTVLGNWRGQVEALSSHLACFHGGNWILGGRLLRNETIVNLGLELHHGCWNTYDSTASGIGPEIWSYSTNPPEHEPEFQKTHGFNFVDSQYQLRPEVIESNFYAWRATGDMMYYNNALKFVDRINQHLSVDGGYAGLEDVNRVDVGNKQDHVESFWFGETLKYLYLTFDDPDRLSLDEWVFTTEAHPLKTSVSSALRPPRRRPPHPHPHMPHSPRWQRLVVVLYQTMFLVFR